MAKRIIASLLAFFTSIVCLPLEAQITFSERYSNDYIAAVEKVVKISPLLDSIGKFYNLPPKEIISIVFPEIVRYSIYSDVIEFEMLKLFYVEKGTKYSDFSVGLFQIKPSFAESIENQIKLNKLLLKKYSNLMITSVALKEQRQIRLNRLNSIESQLLYIAAFYDLMNIKFKDVAFEGPVDRIALYATAYNSGFSLSYNELKNRSKVKLFPEGKICINCYNYNYSDIAVQFYKNLK